MTAPVSITFSDVTVTIGEVGDFHLKRCGQCKSLVLPDDAQDHANWHAALTRSVQVSGLGFGVVGQGSVL
jgi:hypothetical protein